MTKRSNKFQLGYFEEGDSTNSTVEMQRFETLDAQLHAVFDILGNGIINGWSLVASSGLSVIVTPGSGHVTFVAVESENNVTINNLTANSRNYIYATLNPDSYWNKDVTFASYASLDSETENVYLGYVDTDATSITDVNVDGRRTLGYLSLIQSLVSSHRHIGGTENPDPINLSTDVQGTIGQDNLPDLDASIITTGLLDEARFPTLDHITKLVNQGTLTHAQLDAFTETLSISDNPLMGETSTVNLLQLILALKHLHPSIDDYLVNSIVFIPGINPMSDVDTVSTTANVNTVGMTIEGEDASGQQSYTNIWSTEAHFNQGTNYNVLVDGDSVCLDTEEQTLVLDSFNNITGWTIITSDLSSVPSTLTLDNTSYANPPSSGKITIGDQEVEIALEFNKTFDAQNWASYKYMVLYLNTTSVQHGDVYLYIRDANAGVQDSHTKILDRNTPTINVDTLQNGWQEVRIDVSGYTRTTINTIGLYVSTQEGWDTSKGFEFNIDQMYLTTGNIYKAGGYTRLVFGSAFSYNFWRLQWDASIPTDAESAGLELKFRYRLSNDGISYSSWSSYSSTSPYALSPDNLYKYIEVEAYFGASTSLTRTACLKKLYLDFYASDTDSSFVLNTEDDWVGGTLFNVDTTSNANSLSIASVDEVGNFQYGTEGKSIQLSNTFSELYTVTGTALPKSTYQALNGLSPSFGLITGISRGSDGNLWLADVDNDRIVEVDKSGQFVKGFCGSFLTEPYDPYGTEDNGPGSNVDIETISDSTSSVTELDVLHSFYNTEDGILTIVFNADLENIYDANAQFNIDGIFVKVGSQRINLHDSTVTLFGVDDAKYNDWFGAASAGTDATKFLNQFAFTSHVMQIALQGADKTYMSYMVNQESPSVVAYTPYEQERKTSSSVTVKFLLYNYDIGGTNAIEVQIDSDPAVQLYTPEYAFTGLSDGLHTVQFNANSSGTLLTNIEASGSVSFIVDTASSFSSPRVGIKAPKPNQIYSASPVTIEFEAENFPILPTGQHIQYTLDSESTVDYYSSDALILDDLEAGEHTVKFELVDENGNALYEESYEASGFSPSSANGQYTLTGTYYNGYPVYSNGTYYLFWARFTYYVGEPYTWIISPRIEDIETTPDSFFISNPAFGPLYPTNNGVQWNQYGPVTAGYVESSYPYSLATIGFIVGLNSDAIAKLHVNKNSVYTSDGITNLASINHVDIATVYMSNMYAPVDVQVVPDEASIVTNGLPTVIVAKMRSPSSTIGLSSGARVTEFVNRLAIAAGGNASADSTLVNVSTAELIYGTNYLDGHSVVQLDMDGDVIMSNNAAVFAPTKVLVKNLLGSAEKIGDSEILIADAYNKRAIITYTNLNTQVPEIEWQYDSDRYVSDFHIALNDFENVSIGNDAITNDNAYIRQGVTVVWTNNSGQPVTIYSGTTTTSQFALDPDLTLYGELFTSPVLQPGERFSYKFTSYGEFDWFVYFSGTAILTGQVNVTKNRLSSSDVFVILENDGLESPFSSRVIKVNAWGNILWSWGSGFLIKPRDARPLLNGGVVVST